MALPTPHSALRFPLGNGVEWSSAEVSEFCEMIIQRNLFVRMNRFMGVLLSAAEQIDSEDRGGGDKKNPIHYLRSYSESRGSRSKITRTRRARWTLARANDLNMKRWGNSRI